MSPNSFHDHNWEASISDGAGQTLPPELWEQIVSYHELIPEESLLDLAFLSRQCYRACLLAYLNRLGIPNPQKRIEISIQDLDSRRSVVIQSIRFKHDALSILRLPYLVDHTNSFICSFPKNINSTPFCNRVLAALNRFRTVKHVKLDFNQVQDRHVEEGDDEGLSHRSNTIGRLLNMVLEKGCETLEIAGLEEMRDIYVYRPIFPVRRSLSTALESTVTALSTVIPSVKSISRSLSALHTTSPASHSLSALPQPEESILQGSHWRFERAQTGKSTSSSFFGSSAVPQILATLSPLACQNIRLQSLSIISSRSLVQPPLLQWLYSALVASSKAGCLERLAINRLDLPIGPYSFATFISFIGAAVKCDPGIKVLELEQFGPIDPEPLNEWLAGFQSLQKLSLKGPWFPHHVSLEPVESYPPPVWPNLTELTVAAEWFGLSWTSNDWRDHFPILRTLRVAIPDFGVLRDNARVQKQFLGLSELYNREGGELAFKVELCFPVGGSTMYWFWLGTRTTLDASTSWTACVEGLAFSVELPILDIDEEHFTRPGSDPFVPWLLKFSNLKRIYFKTNPSSREDIIKVAGWRARPVEYYTRRLADLAVSGVTEKLLHLEHVEVDGDVKL
ncbi:hypothetical protein FA15DRAFT_756661 [Coprinopsis marcescibilis]|uniref:Uncharacterized protein n=1 Tax=Coprinopsis marcescibilis TaxID=230819 RepID=A0A5C3L7S4_COPMA|nr:hypothetical protein FA15DRAFT_756661 [Coprinopsis marcescibilis]